MLNNSKIVMKSEIDLIGKKQKCLFLSNLYYTFIEIIILYLLYKVHFGTIYIYLKCMFFF